MESEKIPCEIYRLILEHYSEYDGSRVRLEEPLVVQMVVNSSVPNPVYLNRMLDMMRDQVLRMAK